MMSIVLVLIFVPSMMPVLRARPGKTFVHSYETMPKTDSINNIVWFEINRTRNSVSIVPSQADERYIFDSFYIKCIMKYLRIWCTKFVFVKRFLRD